MSSQILKRKSTSSHGATSKRARCEEDLAEYSDAPSDYEVSESSDGECLNYASPLTSISAPSTPRYPSNLKTIHCTYPDCEKTFNRPAKLEQHIRSHTNTRPFVCPHPPCTKAFLRNSHLQHHVKSAHSEVRKYVCTRPGCGKSFVTGTRLKRHAAVHEGQDRFRCDVVGCGKSFRKHGTLHKHVTVVHEGKSPFICQAQDDDGETCGAGFDTAAKLKSHEARLHGSKRFWCTVCCPNGAEMAEEPDEHEIEGVAFSTYADLQAHIGIKHPPTCLECGRRCASQRELKKHIEVKHDSQGMDERRTHICPKPECGRGFTKKNNLTVHMQTVHGEKRFVCGAVNPRKLNKVRDWDGAGACGTSFTSKSNLEEHIRIIHLGLQRTKKQTRTTEEDGSEIRAPPRRVPISSLLRLTGSGYENESGRYIPCMLPGCPYRFMRIYDLSIHLSHRHGLLDVEIQSLLPRAGTDDHGAETLARPGLDGSSNYATAQDLEAEKILDNMRRGDAVMEDVQEGVLIQAGLGTFNIARGEQQDKNGARVWQGRDADTEMMIDPALRQVAPGSGLGRENWMASETFLPFSIKR